jgi:hypothetical protein
VVGEGANHDPRERILLETGKTSPGIFVLFFSFDQSGLIRFDFGEGVSREGGKVGEADEGENKISSASRFFAFLSRFARNPRLPDALFTVVSNVIFHFS